MTVSQWPALFVGPTAPEAGTIQLQSFWKELSLAIGFPWRDTTANSLKFCTSLSPVTFAADAGGSAHTIKEAGVALTARTGLNFLAGFDLADDAVGDETEVSLDLSEVAAGGELGGNMDAPTVDATHSGSAHHNAVTLGDTTHTLATQALSGAAASATVVGHVELATAAETTTGTDATRAVTPDGLAGSDYGKRVVGILINDSTALTTGDGKAYFRVPAILNGWNLVAVAAHIQAGTALVTIDIYNVTDSQDMLSTAITIDANETDSSTALNPAVINATYDDVATADWIRIDATGAGTGTTWCFVELTFQLP